MRSIITRIVVAVLTVIAAFSVAMTYNAMAQRSLVSELARINQGFVPVARQLDEIGEEARSLARALSTRDPATLRRTLRASIALFPFDERISAQLDQTRDHLDLMLSEDLRSDERAFVANIRAAADVLLIEARDIRERVDTFLLVLDDGDALEPSYGELATRVIAFERRVDGLSRIVEERTDAAIVRAETSERVILMRVILVSAGATLFAVLVLLVIGRSLAPIRQLTSLASRLKEGDYDAEPVDAGNDEIGVLAREFTGMAEAIRARDAILRAQKQELEDAYAALVTAQRAQVQAERLAAVGEIAARVTHELRNPLSSIGLNAEMLADELPSDGASDARDMLRTIEGEVARLTELTERYLSMARSDEPQLARTDVAALVRDVMAQRDEEHRRAAVATDVETPDVLMASADGAQLRQVLINLLRNALQAVDGRRDARVAVTLEAHEDTWTCSVHDSGDGVPADEVESVFEPFVTGRADGTGLGLSICRRIVRRHGGELRVARSERLGGAAFSLTVPNAGRAATSRS